MPLYFFDSWHDGRLITDHDGLELPDAAAAQAFAVKGLADLAADALPRARRRSLAVDVRDYHHRLVLRTELTLETHLSLE